MYFIDFMNSNVDESGRYFLSGDNDFLKSIVIKRIADSLGRKIERVSSTKDIMDHDGLFEHEYKRLYIVGPKSNPKRLDNYIVKLSKGKINKTFKDNGFTDVICSNLFPSQASQFASILLNQKGLSKKHARTIAKFANHDPFTIYNTIEVLSFLENDVSHEELIFYCSGLMVPDAYKIIDYFVEGQYEDFLNFVHTTKLNMYEVLWGLLSVMLKLQQAYVNPESAKSWYNKKMLSAASKISHLGFDILIIYIKNLCSNYGENRELLLLKLHNLILYMRGVVPREVFINWI